MNYQVKYYLNLYRVKRFKARGVNPRVHDNLDRRLIPAISLKVEDYTGSRKTLSLSPLLYMKLKQIAY